MTWISTWTHSNVRLLVSDASKDLLQFACGLKEVVLDSQTEQTKLHRTLQDGFTLDDLLGAFHRLHFFHSSRRARPWSSLRGNYDQTWKLPKRNQRWRRVGREIQQHTHRPNTSLANKVGKIMSWVIGKFASFILLFICLTPIIVELKIINQSSTRNKKFVVYFCEVRKKENLKDS